VNFNMAGEYKFHCQNSNGTEIIAQKSSRNELKSRLVSTASLRRIANVYMGNEKNCLLTKPLMNSLHLRNIKNQSANVSNV